MYTRIELEPVYKMFYYNFNEPPLCIHMISEFICGRSVWFALGMRFSWEEYRAKT